MLRERVWMIEESTHSIRVGDGTKVEDAKRIVADASVVISTAGPFLDYSKEIVNACLDSGSHYVDITGETPFVRDMLDRGHLDRARKTVFTSYRVVVSIQFRVISDATQWFKRSKS